MSEVMDLENDPTPVAAVPAAVEAAPAEPAIPEDPDETAAVEVQGGKYVPLGALKAVRGEIQEWKTKAADADTLRNTVAQLQGSLATFQHLQQQLQHPPPAAPPADAIVADPDLLDLARSLDYYTPTGEPDLARAGKHAALIQKQATKIAQQMVAPMQQNAAHQQSAANFQRALRTTAPNGAKPKETTLTWMWQNLPPEYTADPRVAQVLPALALGLDTLQGGQLPPPPAAPAGPPMVTEGLGAAPAVRRTAISDGERAVLSNRGMREDTYHKLTEGFKPGRTSTLED